ncbi:MAG: trypsin-like peptidase domain-containing protein [Lachnospiraceae bacterium]|nr:trypsin-like peptidase domain-containing protein [Lachnospiraceae bacterium]
MSDDNLYPGMNFDPMTGERLRPEENAQKPAENAAPAQTREAGQTPETASYQVLTAGQASAVYQAPVAEQVNAVEPAPVTEQVNTATPAPAAEQVNTAAPAPVAEQVSAAEPAPVAEQVNAAVPVTAQESVVRQASASNAYFDRVGETPVRENNDRWADVYAQEMNKGRKAKSVKKAKEKKQGGGFFKKAVAAAALAVIFGGVAGGTFYGICAATGVWEKNAATNVPAVIENQPAIEQDIPVVKPKDITQTIEGGNIPIVNPDSIQLVTTDMSEMVEEVIPAMVTILNTGEEERDWWGRSYTPQAGGTGVIIGENETELLIVTNHHVARDSKKLEITFIDNTSMEARVKGMDPSMDLAVLAVSMKDLSEETKSKIVIAKLGDSDNLKLGQPAVVIGNALGYGISVTDGVISALNREMTTEDGNKGTFIQTDAAVNHGNSGGALVNIKGELIGIVSNKMQGESVEGMGYAIPISAASPIIKELMEYQQRTELVAEAEQGYLGVKLQNVSDEASEYYGLPEGGYVYYVVEGSGADKAGIKKGDVITRIEKMRVTSNADARSILQYYKQGEEVTVCYSRLEDGEYVSHEVKVLLGSAEAAK